MSGLKNTRRTFLQLSAVAGVGLVTGIVLTRKGPEKTAAAKNAEFKPNAFLQINTNNEIHFYVPSSEMGQGIITGLTTLVAEELRVSPDRIVLHQAGPHADFNNPVFNAQVTGGSTSTRGFYAPLRKAAATMRVALEQAASNLLGEAPEALGMRDGFFRYKGQSIPYGDFAEYAAHHELPTTAALTAPDEFRFIGTESTRLDAVSKSTGTAEFGLDVDIPGIHRAVVVRCPVNGGRVKSCDTSKVETMPGIAAVVVIYDGVAVVSEDYWRAKKAAEKLEIEWEYPPLADYSTDGMSAQLKSAIDEQEGQEAFRQGRGNDALQGAEHVVEADYWAPYLAHATMEPMNCTAVIKDGRCDIWVPTQAPGFVQIAAAAHTGIDKENITVNVTLLGGGFGRRANLDFAVEAVQIAKATGLPIQVVWSREDDMRHDFYRPASYARLKAGLNTEGALETWSVTRAGPNILDNLLGDALDTVSPEVAADGSIGWAGDVIHRVFAGKDVAPSSIEGLHEDYDVPNKEVRHISMETGLPTGYWRSVGHSFSGFFKESFIDEIAHATGQDPLAIRLKHLKNDPRLKEVTEVVAKAAGWGKNLPEGHFHGIAAHNSFESAVAQVAEVSVTDGKIKVHKITCAVNCGLAINPDIIRAQMESGIVYGMTAALYGQIDLDKGVVRQSNFHDYPMLRMNETPEIEVHIIASEADPSGVGEPGLPPVAAAIGNAVFAASGKRLRHLPFKLA